MLILHQFYLQIISPINKLINMLINYNTIFDWILSEHHENELEFETVRDEIEQANLLVIEDEETEEMFEEINDENDNPIVIRKKKWKSSDSEPKWIMYKQLLVIIIKLCQTDFIFHLNQNDVMILLLLSFITSGLICFFINDFFCLFLF